MGMKDVANNITRKKRQRMDTKVAQMQKFSTNAHIFIWKDSSKSWNLFWLNILSY